MIRVWRWVLATERPKADDQEGTSSTVNRPWAYRLVIVSILGVIIAFLVVMMVFAVLGVFTKDNAANVSAALSSLFGIVGTLVGTYFGIKASSEAQSSLESTHNQAITTAQSAIDSLTQRGAVTPREDLVSSINNLHVAWNASNQETVMGFFTDNADVRVASADKTDTYMGKEEITSSFVGAYIPGSQVDSRNYRSEENRVMWESTVTALEGTVAAESFKQRGFSSVEGTATAVFDGRKIRSLTFTLSPATTQRRKAQEQPPEPGIQEQHPE